MLCDQRINTQCILEASEARLSPEEKLRLRAGMADAVAGLRKLRLLKMVRDSHKRLYRRRGHLIRASSRAFQTSPRGKQYAREYQRRRRKENPYYHFLNWLHGSINRSLKSQSATKCGRTEQLIGCTRAELRAHLESQFGTEFTWANRSTVWDVDHLIPVSKFLLSDPEEQKWLSNWRNLRPLGRKDNQSKHNKLPSPMPAWIPTHIAARILARSGHKQTVESI